MGGDRTHGRRHAHGAAVNREDPITRLQHAIGRLAALDRQHGGRRDERLDRRVEIAQREIAVEARAREDRPEQHERDQQVHARPGEDHHDSLPRRLVAVGALGHLGVEPLDLLGGHARDLHVPPRGDRTDHVLGFSSANAARAWAGRTARTAPRASPQPSRRGSAPARAARSAPRCRGSSGTSSWAQCGRRARGCRRSARRPLREAPSAADPAQSELALAHLTQLGNRLARDLRACRSASYSDSNARTGSAGSSTSVRSIVSAIALNGRRPCRNACTAISLAAFRTHGPCPPPGPPRARGAGTGTRRGRPPRT